MKSQRISKPEMPLIAYQDLSVFKGGQKWTSLYSVKPKQAIRTSMREYHKEEWMTNVPLYGIETPHSAKGLDR